MFENGENACRAEAWVRARYPGLSRRHAREALENGLVLRPGGACLRKGDKITPGTALLTDRLDSHLARLREGTELEVAVVDEWDDFVVIDKPAGLPSHPVGLFDERTVSHWALKRYPQAAGEFPEVQPTLAPHRLDTGTSGLLVVALTRRAYDEWREKFRSKRVTKSYHAWCWGDPAEDSFVVDAPLGHDPRDKRKMAVGIAGGAEPLPPIQEARTEIQVITRHDGRFLASVTSRTGVTHQIRAHLASRGFPLVGDWLYDPEHAHRPFQTRFHQLRAVGLATEGFVWELEMSRAIVAATNQDDSEAQ